MICCFNASLEFVIKFNNYVFRIIILYNRHSLTIGGFVGLAYMIVRILYFAFCKSVIRRFNTGLLFIIKLYDYIGTIDILNNRHSLTVVCL